MSQASGTGKRPLVIIGGSAFAEVACEYFTHDSGYRVEAFAVERQYLPEDRQLLGKPVVAFEDLEAAYPPGQVDVYVAIVYTQMNRLRTRLLRAARQRGYATASYVSSRAAVWPNAQLGEHVFIMEHNTVQPFTRIGENTVLWSGNHIGHHSTVEENCFISSHVVVSGFCRIGANSFMGVNSSVGNNITVGRDNWIGPGVALTRDTAPGEIYKVDTPAPSRVGSLRFFRVNDALE